MVKWSDTNEKLTDTNEKLSGKNVEESVYGPVYGTIPAYAWKY